MIDPTILAGKAVGSEHAVAGAEHHSDVSGAEKASKLASSGTEKWGKLLVGSDIKSPPGSEGAQKAWKIIDQQAHSPEAVAKAKALGHEKAVGMYDGRPLIPGTQGEGHADFKFLVDKLVYTKGFSPEVAKGIAAKAAAQVPHATTTTNLPK